MFPAVPIKEAKRETSVPIAHHRQKKGVPHSLDTSGSRHLGHRRGRETSFPDHMMSKKRRTQLNSMPRAGCSSYDIEIDYEHVDSDESEEDSGAEFTYRACPMSNIGPLTRERLYEENDSDDMVKEIDATEFWNKTSHHIKIGSPTRRKGNGGPSTSISRKNVDCTTKNLYHADDSCDSDHGRPNLPGSFVRKGSTRVHGFSQRNTAAVGRVTPFANHSGSFSSEYAHYFGVGQTDKSSSSSKEGNSDEDTDPEELTFEKIVEVEFISNNNTHSVHETGSFTRQEVNKGGVVVTSAGHVCDASKKIDEKRKNMAGSADQRRKKADKESVNDNINACQRDEISSGIASRTRSKTTSIKKFPYVSKVALNLSDESSSSTECGYDSSGGDDFKGKRSYHSDSTESLYPEETYGAENFLSQKSLSSSVSSKESGEKEDERNKAPEENEEINTSLAADATVEEGIQVNSLQHVSNNLCNEEKECNETAFEKQKVPLQKRQVNSASSKENGEKARGRNKVAEENKEINTILADDATVEKGLQVKRNGKKKKSLTSPYTNQSHLPKDSSETEGVKRLQNQSLSGMRRLKKAVSPVISEDKACDHSGRDFQQKIDMANSCIDGNRKTENIPVACEGEKQINTKLPSSRHYDLCTMLADSVLERGPPVEHEESDNESNQPPTTKTQNTLPLKFRFEDEAPEQVEKTEYEKEIARLFDEFDISWEMLELDLPKYPEVHPECESSPAEETQDARCARGKHEFILEDAEGLVCIYCRHVELGPRDIMPQWAINTWRHSGRKRPSCTENVPEFDEIHLNSSVNKDVAFDSSNDGTVWNIKPGVRETMYKHQQEGFEFLWTNLAGSISLAELKSPEPREVGGCIISHAPGTGKTRLTIVFIETYLKLFPDCRPVIIAPASMLLTWEEEFKKWYFPFSFHNLNNPDLSGEDINLVLRHITGSKRQNTDTVRMIKIYMWNKGGRILGISYSLFEKLTGEKYIKSGKNEKRREIYFEERAESLRKILLEKPELVILDEGHTPRNQRSNIWNALLKLKTEKRVILSGTPFQNNFGELFNTLRLVRPAVADVLAEDKTFAEIISSKARRKYKRKDIQSASISEVIDGVVLEKLKITMSPFVNVHKGTILQESLPGLRDCVILLKPAALQKSLIETLEGHPSTFEFEHKVALISVHPYLFKYCDSAEKRNPVIDSGLLEASKLNPNEGAKTKFIMELLCLTMGTSEKVLIFSQYIQPLELIKEQLKQVFEWVEGKQILQMEGKLEQKQRQSLINIYNNPLSEAKVMLASTKCCSEGISLVGASRVVLLDVVWNPSVERQAICRAYRIGQKKFVYTYHLMTSGTTEGDKYCRQAEKERLSELVFCSSSGESDKKKNPAAGSIEDLILEKMVGQANLTDMFEKIINQPKESVLIQNFGLTS